MDFHFYKYHALGNDYIVIDPNKIRVNLSEENIRLICHRNFGIGSDGILYGPLFQNDSIRLRILNPDGSEAEKSGNGIRIFSRYLFDAGYLKSNQFYLETLGGKVHVELLDSKANQIKVDMGQVTFYSSEIPVVGNVREVVREELDLNGQKFTINCLSIGNPHCVILLDTISKELVEEIGPIIEKHELFPNRINVQLLKVLDRNNIKIEIWERGAGYTLASGSSSCATASVAFKLGLVDSDVKVHMPGGIIKINISRDGHVHMTGPVTGVSKGLFFEDLLAQIGFC
ncbi:MAG: Diaminopimelate epimerase [Firmicutes bacterium]|nr:Diaminopimelate epimerase [Bacillota bacterium]